jgi:eukaryotic-like serine/threonine-protein kinase
MQSKEISYSFRFSTAISASTLSKKGCAPPMEPNRWRRLEDIYHAALDKSAALRPAFLAEACGDDEALRHEIEALIAHSESDGGLLDRPPVAIAAGVEMQAGQQLGPYRLIDAVGAGGMGKVYRAVDTRLGRTVAIKMSRPEFASFFQREAEAISALNHPNICTLYDVGPDYLVMEYIEGESLASRLERGPLPLSDALDCAAQMAEGLARAHEAGIVHRDLKPGNVMIKGDGLVKVLDFGLARASHPESAPVVRASLTGAGVLAGTPAYMSPEQVRGGAADARSDVFSFGATLYEMLTGKRPFPGNSSDEVLSAVLDKEPPPVSQVIPQVPAELGRVVAQCLRKDASERFQSMGEVRAALEALRESAGGRVTARRWWWVALAAGAAGLATLAAWLVLGRADRGAPVYQAVPLTSVAGTPRFPTISPDGKTVAFVWDGPEGNSPAIYLQQVGATEPIRRANAPDAAGAQWSPDGQSLLFTRGRLWNWEFFTMPALAGAERKVGQSKSPVSSALWAPDGKHFILTDRGGAKMNRNALYLQSLATGERRPLTIPPQEANGDFGGAISPKGDVMVFYRMAALGFGDLCELRLKPGYQPAGEPRRLVRDNSVAFSQYGPDGRTIFYSTVAGDTGVRRVRPGSSAGPERVALPAEFIRAFTLAPAARRMVYQQDSNDTNIWRLDLEKGDPPVPFLASSRADSSPTYSPDGRRIAFVSNRSGPSEIWVVNADGSGAVAVAGTTPTAVGGTDWLPDSRQVVFSTPEGQTNWRFAVNIEGGRPRKLAAEGGRYARDGKSVYMNRHDGAWNLYRAPLDGSEPVPVTRSGGANGRESPDGKYLYYGKRMDMGPAYPSPPNSLWRLPLDEGEAKAEVIVPEIASTFNFTVSNRGAYYLTPWQNGSCEIRFWDAATRKTSFLWKMDKRPWSGMTVSPDGRYLLFAQIDRQQSELMLVESFP